MCDKTARKWAWYYTRKVGALKDENVSQSAASIRQACITDGASRAAFFHQIVWPENWNENDEDTPIFICTVDGMHCRVHEPKHPTLSNNPQYYSHKFKQAGLNYESVDTLVNAS